MGIFGAISIAGTGVDVSQTWLDTVAGNIANMNDVTTPGSTVYREESVVATPLPPTNPAGPGRGVGVVGIALGSAKGRFAYDPSSPLANAQGYVEYPAVNLGQQMVDMVMAQTSYQANVAVINHARSAYKDALTL
ncbi:MAG: flagellar basal-body rod protein FlgC [Actinobacteria bacterium]|jgi:flagellar basal-body rod protein FlgC|nr:flagellar basal-body rod protein FlgC [Actinomycetota bacterium]MCL6094609.1 flagellar basal-body rod protein FlgC [Actinomycetota bacterium]